MVTRECERWEWREILASEHGPPDPSTRLVLFVLALHMNSQGGSCYPSQQTIATRTGLSERSVRNHLQAAEKLGWIKVSTLRRPKQAWFNHEYVATIPEALAQYIPKKPWDQDAKWTPPEEAADSAGRSPEVPQRAANGAGRPANGAERAAIEDTTAGNLRHDARQNLPTNSSSNSPSNTSNNTPYNVLAARAGVLNLNGKPEEPDPEAEKRALEAAEARARIKQAAAEAKAETDKAKREEKARQDAEDRVRRIRYAIEHCPSEDDNYIVAVTGGEKAGVTLAEVQRLRKQAPQPRSHA
ncbi:MAG: helix-turn-helix domain-containing protein [Steroidobacteraceae bacterium]